MDPESLVAFISPLALAWIRTQRDRYRPGSMPIEDPVLPVIESYFSVATLERARYAYVDTLENPPFYADLARALPGISLIDFAGGDGITFDDTILISDGQMVVSSLPF